MSIILMSGAVIEDFEVTNLLKYVLIVSGYLYNDSIVKDR